MESVLEHSGRYVRILALVSLGLGLADAARLLGVSMGGGSPLATMGPAAFTLLSAFSLSRLFAAVGLWMKASWGAVLLVASTAAELALYLLGNADVRMNAVGFGVRVVLLLSIVLVFALGVRLHWARVQD